jgi:hypothetical protein
VSRSQPLPLASARARPLRRPGRAGAAARTTRPSRFSAPRQGSSATLGQATPFGIGHSTQSRLLKGTDAHFKASWDAERQKRASASRKSRREREAVPGGSSPEQASPELMQQVAAAPLQACRYTLRHGGAPQQAVQAQLQSSRKGRARANAIDLCYVPHIELQEVLDSCSERVHELLGAHLALQRVSEALLP